MVRGVIKNHKVTEFGVHVEWELENFVSHLESEWKDVSPDFSCSRFIWHLEIAHKSESVSLFLMQTTHKVHAMFKFGIRLKDGLKEMRCCLTKEFQPPDNFGTHELILKSELMKRKLELLPNDTLTVACSVYHLNAATKPEIMHENFFLFSSSVNKLVQGLKELLLSGKHSDMLLIVKNKEFRAHRNILAAQSPVFSAMMEHDTQEKATGIVTVQDSDPETFPEFLHFLYTGSIPNLNSTNVIQLYVTADKYQVTELKKTCLNYMKSCLWIENFCDTLSFSLKYEEKELTDEVTHFFVLNSIEIAETAKWLVFLGENPVAGNELFLKALKSKKQ